ncbi:MAG: ATP-dependent Clp protease adapter ClpS [Cellvibrionales bacterium]|nr:ATP-dependent Clp protease adapter ClpS [Cellvibrionales bacterium]
MRKASKIRLTLSMNTNESSDVDSNSDADVAVAPQTAKPKLAKPKMYQVVMLNDDYTPMEFVVDVLQSFFNMDQSKATQTMLDVHNKGKAVCGTYPYDIAETKALQVNEFSRENEHPLMCNVETVD